MWRSVKELNLRRPFNLAPAFQADPLPLWQHCKLARNRGVDPHSISAAHSFRNWCRSRPALFRRLFGTAPRFRSSSSWVKAKRAPITPVRYVVREVRFELTCLWASGFEPDTYTSSVTRAWCLPRDLNPQSLRPPILNRMCMPIPPRRHTGDPCGI